MPSLSLLCIPIIIKEEEVSCRGCWSWRPEPWWRGWWRFRTCPLGEHTRPPLWLPAWWWMGSFWATMMMVIMYLNLESRVCMNTSNLFKKELKIKTHVDRVCSVWLLNLNWDALIFLNFRLYFLKSDLYFFWVYFLICCKLVQNLVIRWCHLHCLVSKLSTRLCTCIATLPRNALLALSACITCILLA